MIQNDPEFYKLSEALQESETSPGTKIYAFEQSTNVRRYRVSKPADFYAQCEQMHKLESGPRFAANQNSSLRWHEVIRQDKPCRLYFDLEFDKHVSG